MDIIKFQGAYGRRETRKTPSWLPRRRRSPNPRLYRRGATQAHYERL